MNSLFCPYLNISDDPNLFWQSIMLQHYTLYEVKCQQVYDTPENDSEVISLQFSQF